MLYSNPDDNGRLGDGAEKSQIISYEVLLSCANSDLTMNQAIKIMAQLGQDGEADKNGVADESNALENSSDRGIDDNKCQSVDHKVSLSPPREIDSAGDKAIQTTKEKKKDFLSLPPELRLTIYEYFFTSLEINGNDHTLDQAITRPALLRANKLVRTEAMQSCLNGIFSAIIELKSKHKKMKLESRAITAAVQVERDAKRQGSLMFAAAQMSFKEGHWSMRISRYAGWLQAKLSKLKNGGEVYKSSEAIGSEFEAMVVSAKGARVDGGGKGVGEVDALSRC
ncbi:hypothetical protein DOTSEDRAFT_27022 [Dothistroma septosporum NZE10]|uniref:F-box domain-containing protein n=1 Tax=Dothistroma septosporum (strain NZE10 / CBS 128990) TaxID=675120 RepID=N1PKS2_DOTSN|nr:hypothetical protein DOTSEDRAFT_27022 [Dothistroma septosporum NZE10]